MASDESERFVDRMVARADVAHITLCFLTADQSTRTLDTYELPLPEERKAADLVEEIEERALRHANTLGGSHAFELTAWSKSGKNLAAEYFRVTAEALPGSKAALGIEPPNEVGSLAQQMKHNEAIMRLFVNSMDKREKAVASAIDSMSKQRDSAEQRYLGAFDLVMKALLGERQHELALVEATGKAQFKTKMLERLSPLLTEAASAVVGKQLGAEERAVLMGIKGFAGSLHQDQVIKILEALQPEQQAAFYGMLKRLMAEETKQATTAAADGKQH